ncbi:isoprenylcysteine carboxylmethyltransferase family protein [Polaribacter batillariae]|uniref:Isoprenylcysteine carboxylmethyltransferase family protein n=1 Tax=Polaribacter batillariae TaxID=2808900 RepID=A0ABX7STL1_9FLAO|nr:isoprenylcysteine carboxylmethyltransferase family protein [Polaribacter batillariae]QTD37584.1 isoprenylcysteine carboxylmethyltransferase family protein [Polaribacter batillariae]
MKLLLLRNFVFTILQSGTVVGLIPFLIVEPKLNDMLTQQLKISHYLGMLIFTLGFFMMLICIRSFAIDGKGTLSPADPTKRLVIKGLYKFSRNPMYIGVLTILMGETIFFKSYQLLIYLLLIFIAFNIFIILVEEPRLRRDFGKEYLDYCKKVERWG